MLQTPMMVEGGAKVQSFFSKAFIILFSLILLLRFFGCYEG